VTVTTHSAVTVTTHSAVTVTTHSAVTVTTHSAVNCSFKTRSSVYSVELNLTNDVWQGAWA